jgi:hypothetical protein
MYLSPMDISSIDCENEVGGISRNEWKRYSSPELLKGEVSEGNSETVVFSLGMILYSILNGNIPFNEIDGETAENMIISGKRPSIECISKVFKKWKDLIISCWNSEGRKRIRLKDLISEVIKHGGSRFEAQLKTMIENEMEKKKKKETTIEKGTIRSDGLSSLP